MLWTREKDKLLQVFGPYPTEKAANDAADRLDEWPAIKNGEWEVIPLHANPKGPVQQTATQSWTGGTITLYGQTFPTTYSQLTYTYQPPLNGPWNVVNPSVITPGLLGF